MLHRARNNARASQGGHTEYYPPKNENGQYQHDNIFTFVNAVRRVLKTSYNPSNPGNGMMKLLNSSTGVPLSAVLAIKSNNVATIATALATSTLEAVSATTALVPGAACIAPIITTCTEYQDEANCLNLNCQAVVVAKEGPATSITDKVGSNVTDIVLRTVNEEDFKGIDDYELHEIVRAAITEADQTATNTVLKNLAGVLGYAFNFQQKVNTNMELLRSREARVQSYGITVYDDHLTLVLLANIELSKMMITAASSTPPSKTSAARSRITMYTTQRY